MGQVLLLLPLLFLASPCPPSPPLLLPSLLSPLSDPQGNWGGIAPLGWGGDEASL